MDYKNDLTSDDDFDNSNGFSDHNGNNGYANGNERLSNTNGLSKAELRKTNKPIMEKRRRARINHCLNELKSLILEAMKKDPARHTKLEKADILEMTVKHLQSVQRQQLNMAIQSDPTVIHKFKTGFVECADEVNRYINQLDGVDAGVRQRLTNHLNNCATSLEQIGSMTNFNNGYRGQINANTIFGSALANPLVPPATQARLFPALPQDLNNNNNNTNSSGTSPATPIQMGGVQLIPSRLPSGEFALIMPNPATVGINAVAPATTLLGGSPSLPFPSSWPNTALGSVVPPTTPQHPSTVTSTQLNDFTTNLKRTSAFTKPIQKISTNNNNSNNNITTREPSPFTNFLLQPAPSSASAGGSIAPFHHPANNLHQNTSTTTTSPPLSPISSASVSSHGDDSSIMHLSSDVNTPSRPTTPPPDTAASQYNFCGVFSTPSSTESSSLNSSRSSIHLQQQQVSSTSGSELRKTTLKRPHPESNDSCDGSEEPSCKKFAPSSEKAGVMATAISEEERDSMWRPW